MKPHNDYTFRYGCESCEERPTLKTTGLCAVCTFGTADALWDWLDEEWSGKERKLAEKYVLEMLAEVELMDEKGNVDPVKAMLLHVDQPVLDKIEALL